MAALEPANVTFDTYVDRQGATRSYPSEAIDTLECGTVVPRDAMVGIRLTEPVGLVSHYELLVDGVHLVNVTTANDTNNASAILQVGRAHNNFGSGHSDLLASIEPDGDHA